MRVPLHPRTAIANAKGQGDGILIAIAARVTRWELVVRIEQVPPLVRVRFAKEVPGFVGELVGCRFDGRRDLVHVLPQRDGATVFGTGVAAGEGHVKVGSKPFQQIVSLRHAPELSIGIITIVIVAKDYNGFGIQRRKAPWTKFLQKLAPRESLSDRARMLVFGAPFPSAGAVWELRQQQQQQ